MLSAELSVIANCVTKRLLSWRGESCRLFHGRGHCFPGLEWLTIDWHPPVAQITCFAEIASLPDSIDAILSLLIEQLGGRGLEAVRLQRRDLAKAPSEIIYGTLPAQVWAHRDGLRYKLRLDQQQNTGFFLDMTPGHQWLAERAQSKRILNLFAFTCAFSVVAVANGADGVVNIDMSRGALNIGRDNHRANDLATDGVQFLGHDIFRSLGKLKRFGPYDIVIMDPPTFQKGSFDVRKDYRRLLAKLPGMLAPSADLLLCLNTPFLPPDFVTELVAEQLPQASLVERLSNCADFPETDADKGLKLMHFTYTA